MNEQTVQKKTRTRLSPEARKAMILDHAAILIAEEGVSAVTVERLGASANISKALIYNYYPSVTAVLQELLTREYKYLRKLQFEAAESANTIEQMVRRVTNVYLSYIKKRGMLLERLAMEPSVANSGGPTAYSREGSVDYLAEILNKNFKIDMEIARAAVDISYGIPATAGQYLLHHDTDAQTIEDITVTMILGSLEAVQQKYDFALRPIR